MATEPNNTTAWIFDFLTGRSEAEIAEIRAFVEAAFPVHETEATITALTEDVDIEEYRSQQNKESRRRFAEAFSDLLRARSTQIDPRSSEERVNIAIDLEYAALRRLIAEPSLHDWQLAQKIEVFGHYLDQPGHNEGDQSARRLFGSIKADLAGLLNEQATT
jgi:hypothetical protein